MFWHQSNNESSVIFGSNNFPKKKKTNILKSWGEFSHPNLEGPKRAVLGSWGRGKLIERLLGTKNVKVKILQELALLQLPDFYILTILTKVLKNFVFLPVLRGFQANQWHRCLLECISQLKCYTGLINVEQLNSYLNFWMRDTLTEQIIFISKLPPHAMPSHIIYCELLTKW